MPGTLLAVTAHPDDESMMLGGTLARYAAEGVRVILVCATRGDAGKAGDPPICSREELPRVREAELRRAAAELGLAAVRVLDYPDGRLQEADEVEIVPLLARFITEFDAEVVATFPPGGLSGHRDHRAISRFTERAFHLARRAGDLRRLYFWTLHPKQWELFLGGKPHHPLDVAVTASIDVAAYVDRKIAAIKCHRSQHLSWERVYRGFPDEVRKLMRRETFYRVHPPFTADGQPEEGLFPAAASLLCNAKPPR